ncbi:tetratricopeptide repeat protein [Nitrogeniibacter aestuarii]|uniref:tetratricopeptide repeat protein n=1 Tax=Nitrogeniibacter aestuarii TaxID=2815343 RepID=UPI001E57F471|nr:hypothetical protein [Nitrogeniibacter aestuarii]
MDRALAPIPPFWTRVPRFFLFPMYPQAILRVLLFSAIPALGAYANHPVAMVLAIGGLSLLAWIFLLRYGSRVLSETALGRLSPTEFSPLEDDAMRAMPYKIFGLFLIPGLLVGFVAGFFGNGLAQLANFLVTVVTPAALMGLIISGSLLTALDPTVAVSTISRIGKPYVLLCVFLFCLSGGQMFLIGASLEHTLVPLGEQWEALQISLQDAAARQDATAFQAGMAELRDFSERMHTRVAGAVLLMTGLAMYFTLIAFNMLGYVLYQFHEALGLEVDAPRRGQAASRTTTAENEDDRRIAQLIGEGNIQDALDMAYEAQRLDHDNIPAMDRYNKLLFLAGKDERLCNHALRLIPRMLDAGKTQAAVDVWKRCRERNPAFRLERASEVMALAQAARTERDPKAAIAILNGFEKAFGPHALLAEAYFLGGRILCEDLGRDDVADQMLRTLIRRFPDHVRVPEARQLRTVIAQMKAQAVRPAPG